MVDVGYLVGSLIGTSPIYLLMYAIGIVAILISASIAYDEEWPGQ